MGSPSIEEASLVRRYTESNPGPSHALSKSLHFMRYFSWSRKLDFLFIITVIIPHGMEKTKNKFVLISFHKR